MIRSRLVEYIFFFGALGFAAYMVWQIFAPFVTALALAAIIVVISYPLFEFLLKYMSRQRRSIAAALSTLVVFVIVVIPIFFASMLLVNEFVSFYKSIDTSSPLAIDSMLSGVEQSLQQYIPGFELNVSEQLKQSIEWFTRNIGVLFAGTISFIFTFLIALMGSFYLFRDGQRLVDWLVSISPLTDTEDHVILQRIARSIRSVATGTVLVALIQGLAATTGFAIFGIERPILWGSMAALGALLPGIGTLGTMVPAIGFLFYVGDPAAAIGLIVWTIAAIVIIDNLIGPHLMSRGNNLHPFVVLVSVLGGISLFGPIGFVLGPVFVSLFMVLLELYAVYMQPENKSGLFKKNKL